MEIQAEKLNLQQETESEYFIPKSRHSPKLGNSVISAIMAQKVQERQPDVKSKWYQNYKVPDSYVGVSPASLPVGEVISAAEALGWNNQQGVDIRPRLVDKATKVARLLDTGSMITATVRKPEDKPDNSVRLVAVNGSTIQTYGSRLIEVKIGRKAYSIEAIVCDVAQDILGMDFVDKFKLNFEWDDFDQSELYIVDKKAKISQELQMVTVPKNLPRLSYLNSQVSSEPVRVPH